MNLLGLDVKGKVDVLKKEDIMRRMHTRYLKYYQNWRDYDMLTTILVMIGLLLAITEVLFILLINFLQQEGNQKLQYSQRTLDYVISNSFVRITITVTTVLALISLLIRNWLYVFWVDFKNSKQLQIKYMELQDYNFNEDEKNQQSMSISLNQTAELHQTTKKIKFQKESHVKAWILKCLSVEFFFEVFLIVVHPLPYIEYEFQIDIINMLSSKD